MQTRGYADWCTEILTPVSAAAACIISPEWCNFNHQIDICCTHCMPAENVFDNHVSITTTAPKIMKSPTRIKQVSRMHIQSEPVWQTISSDIDNQVDPPNWKPIDTGGPGNDFLSTGLYVQQLMIILPCMQVLLSPSLESGF
jgi:hypothetical protein